MVQRQERFENPNKIEKYTFFDRVCILFDPRDFTSEQLFDIITLNRYAILKERHQRICG